MAERIVRQLLDDLDQSEIVDGAGGTVDFAFQGTKYTIDLSNANIAKFEKALKPYIEAATAASGPPRKTSRGRKSKSSRRGSTAPARDSTAAIRGWATDNGHEVSARGRIPAAVIDAYESAHKRSR
ncbi:histone-like nucleoid-structuring protein Lsr2 [Mycolicibacterium sediminis]|uniref:Protein lsr2 n=1 Tax=Mycolicibacterium sediminis TaxID=1286180 RepID=A0A7I7QIL4_9MYCO|nr:Lsr2 family protein [Mycolicibacterium sediminis]BBY26169.1 protein lsr2 precursor [Mycolicibacterium sediminis]